jgi:site-specific recombinase XerD
MTSPLVTTEIEALVNSWRRDLRARNLARKTIKTYGESADQLIAHLAGNGVTTAADVSREHVSDFITQLLATRSASTASVRFRALQQFFAWLVDEEEIAVSPMAKLRPPKIPEQLTPVVGDAAIRALLKACAGKEFRAQRDTAIIRLLLDTGMRLDELAKLRVEDVDLDHDNTATVLGKGRRPRVCPFGAKTAQALDRYLRQRARQKRADVPKLWLGDNGRGAMTDNGIAQVIRKRGAAAGIQACTRTCSGTPSPTSGAWPAVMTTRSCASSAGGPARCSTAMALQRPMPGPVRHTSGSCPATGSDLEAWTPAPAGASCTTGLTVPEDYGQSGRSTRSEGVSRRPRRRSPRRPPRHAAKSGSSRRLRRRGQATSASFPSIPSKGPGRPQPSPRVPIAT